MCTSTWKYKRRWRKNQSGAIAPSGMFLLNSYPSAPIWLYFFWTLILLLLRHLRCMWGYCSNFWSFKKKLSKTFWEWALSDVWRKLLQRLCMDFSVFRNWVRVIFYGWDWGTCETRGKIFWWDNVGVWNKVMRVWLRVICVTSWRRERCDYGCMCSRPCMMVGIFM